MRNTIENPIDFGDSSFRISQFSTDSVDLLLNTPMRLPFGDVISRPSGTVNIILRINGNKYCGFGEGATLPQPVFTDDCGSNIKQAASELLASYGDNDLDFDCFVKHLRNFEFSDRGQHPTARMMAEMAVIDALSKSNNLSVADVLGIPPSTTEVPFGKSLGGGSYDQTIADAEIAINNGARKIKLKVTPVSTETVLSVINFLSQKYTNLEIMVDANGTFDPTQDSDLQKLKLIDQAGLIMIEEPVSRQGPIRGYPAVELLRSRINFETPICLDDCLINLDTTINAINSGIADIVNIKPGRIGSITTALEIGYRSRQLGRQVMIGGMLEATPGRTMTTVIAAKLHQMGNYIPGDLSLAQERLVDDFVPKNRQLNIGPQGGIIIPRNSGWGY